MVTGAASGIGRAIALALAREGAHLWLVDRNEAGLAACAREAGTLGVTARMSVCDLAEPAQIAALVEDARGGADGLNILVNGAGVGYFGYMHAMPHDEWNRLIAVNLLAPIQLSRELAAMLAAGDEGHIVNICSLVGLVPIRKVAAYQTSKFGLLGFTLALRSELAWRGFGVTALCPGFIKTPLLDTFEGPPRDLPAWLAGNADGVARAALKAMRRNRGIVVATPMTHAAWWLMRLAPWLIDWISREGWRRVPKIPTGELRGLQGGVGAVPPERPRPHRPL